MFSLIAVIGKNRELGKQGRLIFELPEDMAYFQETTKGHKVLMGRRTWESLPHKLPGRTNIVVSHHLVEGADEWVSDLGQFRNENKDTEEEIFVIGGGAIYDELLPDVRNLYLTEVEAEVPGADTWFPEFERSEFEREVIRKGYEGGIVGSKEQGGRGDGLRYQFVKYKRKEA